MGFPFALAAAAAVMHVRRAREEDEDRARRDAARGDDLSPRQRGVVDSILLESQRHHAALRMAQSQEKPNLGDLCSAIGIRLREEALRSDLCGWIEIHRTAYEYHYAVVVNSSHPETRRRFTIGHMLGHHYYHRDLFDHRQARGANADRSYDQISDAPWSNPAIDAKCKSRANVFAVGLLMPHARMKRLIAEGLDAEAIAERLCITVRTAELRIQGVNRA